MHLDVGRVQSVGRPDFPEVVGLGLAAFGDDKDALVAGATALLALQLLALPLLGGVVAGHQCCRPIMWFRNGTPP